MFKIFAMAGIAVLVSACAVPFPVASADTAGQERGSTAGGESTAAGLGFHGPVYRGNKTDGPN